MNCFPVYMVVMGQVLDFSIYDFGNGTPLLLGTMCWLLSAHCCGSTLVYEVSLEHFVVTM